MKPVYVSLMILAWFAVPNFVSADWSTYSQQYWVDRGLLERDSLIHRVESPAFEDHFGLSLGRDRGRSESEPDRRSDSGQGTRSFDTFLGPSFDKPDSVDGGSRRAEPWWGRRPEGEPMIKDMKDLNRDPMRSP
mgnify:CR=1 FL=1